MLAFIIKRLSIKIRLELRHASVHIALAIDEAANFLDEAANFLIEANQVRSAIHLIRYLVDLAHIRHAF